MISSNTPYSVRAIVAACVRPDLHSLCGKSRLGLVGVVLLVAQLVPALRAQDWAADRAKVVALGQLTSPPKTYPVDGAKGGDRIETLYYEGLPFHGKPTRVYALLGVPEHKAGGKIPGIVLVHGGGGTAFREWVRRWNDQGFAAIAMGLEGQTDERDPKTRWKRHEWGGPARRDKYADTDEAITDQWMYQAIADTVLANSLLRSLPDVDTSKVGVMGVSWGGVITSTVVGIDPRFAFAIPTYGCGDMHHAGNQWEDALKDNATYREVWDPVLYLPRAHMPTLWFTDLHDRAFSLESQQVSYRASPSPRMTAILPEMTHSHVSAWKVPDSYLFARSIIESGRPWAQQLEQTIKDGLVRVAFRSDRAVDSASLFYTASGEGYINVREWKEVPAALGGTDGNVTATAPLPEGARAFLFVLSCGGATLSSELTEIGSP